MKLPDNQVTRAIKREARDALKAATDTRNRILAKQIFGEVPFGKKPTVLEQILSIPKQLGMEMPRDTINTHGVFEERPWNMPEQTPWKTPKQVKSKMSNPFDIVGEQLSKTGLPEVPETTLSPEAKQRYNFKKSMEVYADELEEAGLKRQADALRAKISNDFKDLVHPNSGSRIPRATTTTDSEENLLGKLLSNEVADIPVKSPEPIVRPATPAEGNLLVSDSAEALTGQQQKAVENFRPVPKPAPHRLTEEKFNKHRIQLAKTLNAKNHTQEKIEKVIQNQLRNIPSPHDRGIYLDRLMNEGIIKPEFKPQVDVIMPKANNFSTGFTSLPETKIMPKTPKATKPGGIVAPAVFVADLLARGVEASKDDAAKYGEQVYDYRISVGDSHEEAQKVALEAYNDVLQELMLQRGINQSPSALFDWTVKTPQHLRNLNEWFWSNLGVEPNYWTTTNTDAINLDSLANGRRDEILPAIIETTGQSTVDSAKATADLGINLVKKPVQATGNAATKLYETGKILSEIDKKRRSRNPDGSFKYNRFKPSYRTGQESSSSAKNITQDHFNLALSLVGKDDTTKIKALEKLSPFDQNAVIQVINDMENIVQY